MRIGELFSGYGGLGMGVQAVLGGSIAWHSEIDPGACKILAHRYPDVPNHGDITAIDWASVEPVDVLTGGSPCQDLSAAGKRAGMTEGTRSNLWVSMREAIAQLRPGLVVWENVRGALSARASSDMELAEGRLGIGGTGPVLRALGRVLGDLADLGYDASWQGLRASDVGAPHGRFRVFVIAWPATDTEGQRRGQGRTEPAGQLGGSDASLSRRAAAPHAADDGRQWAGCAWRGRSGSTDHGHAAAHADRAGSEALSGRPWAGDARRRESVVSGSEDQRQDSSAADRSGDSGRLVHGDDVPAVEWGPYAEAIRRWERVTRPAPAPTDPNKNGDGRLSPRFAEWMMGLPDGWVTDIPRLSRAEKLKAIGNGVCPQQAAEALRLLLPDVEAVAA